MQLLPGGRASKRNPDAVGCVFMSPGKKSRLAAVQAFSVPLRAQSVCAVAHCTSPIPGSTQLEDAPLRVEAFLCRIRVVSLCEAGGPPQNAEPPIHAGFPLTGCATAGAASPNGTEAQLRGGRTRLQGRAYTHTLVFTRAWPSPRLQS